VHWLNLFAKFSITERTADLPKENLCVLVWQRFLYVQCWMPFLLSNH